MAQRERLRGNEKRRGRRDAGRIGEAHGSVEASVRLPADISLDGRYQEGWVELAGGELRLVDSGGRPLLRQSLEEADHFEAHGYVGGGVLEVRAGGVERVFARFSLGHLPQYKALATYLTRRAEGNYRAELDLPEPPVCATCGRPFPPGTTVCPRCLNKMRVLGRLLKTARPHLSLFILAMLLLWVLTGLRLGVPQLHRHLIDNVLQGGGETAQLLFYVVMIGLFQLAQQLVAIVRGRVMATLSGRLSKDLRLMVFEKIQALSLRDVTRHKTGDLMNRVTHDTNRIGRFIQHHLAMGINEGLVFIGIAVLLFTYNWRLAALVLLPAPFVTYVVKQVWKKIRAMYRAQWRSEDRAISLLQDVLSGIRVVKAFGQEEREAGRFVAFSRDFATITARNERTFNTLFPIVGYVLGIGNFLVLYYGGRLVLGEELGFGELVLFSAYAGMLYGPLRFISFFPRWFTEAMTASERIFEVIDIEPEVKDASRPVRHRVQGAVEFRGVTFGYQKHDPVLKDINLKVEPGETIGLVGHSGAGKSTLINLLARFYDPDEGEILIDGVNIKEISQQTLRSQIGVVLQETFLFAGTILENIIYAKPDATPEDAIRAAKIANAHDFIIKFHDGYDTLVGERGQRLSGGERQRIAIARAILHDPRILILDEATASMDTETEYLIQEALARLTRDRTTFAIAHRLSTLRNANRLIVLDKGRIAEVGSHDELMELGGIYYGLVTAQREMARIS